MRAIVYCKDGAAFLAEAARLGFTAGYHQHSSGNVIGFLPLSGIHERKSVCESSVWRLIPAPHSQLDVSKQLADLKIQGKSAYDLRAALYTELQVEDLNPDF